MYMYRHRHIYIRLYLYNSLLLPTQDQDALIEMVDSQNGGVYRQLKGANIRGLACVTDVQIAQNTFENKLVSTTVEAHNAVKL